MDVVTQLIAGGVGLSTILGAGIAIGRRQRVLRPAASTADLIAEKLAPVHDDLKALDGKFHRLSNWRDGLRKELLDEYVPRRELALELKPINDSLKRIEDGMARLSVGEP